MNKEELKKTAMEWLSGWNDRNIDEIMKHYADDVILHSPSIVRRWNIATGNISGKEWVEKHFRKGMEEVPGLHVEFHSILFGVNCIILFYKRETGMLAADYIFFNEAGKVREVRACYGE